MNLTRRRVTLGLGTLALAVPLGADMDDAILAPAAEDRVGMTPDRLLSDLRDLCARLHPATSVSFTALQARGSRAAGVMVDLGLHLVWSPGERWTPYSAEAPDMGQALVALRERISTDLVDLHRPLLRDNLSSRHQVKLGWT